VSGDYTFQNGIDTLRQALKFKAVEMKLVDSVRFENYQRLDGKRDYGFAITGEKAFNNRVGFSGGYADIDRNFNAWNAARILKGKRLFGQVSYNLSPELSLTVLYTNAIKNDFAIPNNRYLEVIMNYNVLKSFQRKGFLK
jgi:hypothetical protein